MRPCIGRLPFVSAVALATALALPLILAAVLPTEASAQAPGTVSPSTQAAPADQALRARVAAALAAAADLPADSLEVEVSGGVVTVVGSVLCSGCGGNATPGGSGTVQQSLGAVVRAVPGVERVAFRLRYRPG